MHTETEFKFAEIVFFGRGIGEYVKMFNLDLNLMIGMTVLDCPSGPAAFAREAGERGISVTACDPMFEHDNVQSLRQTVDSAVASVAVKLEHNRHLIYDDVVPIADRRNSMELFLEDYVQGRTSGRYVAAKLPQLPFPDRAFDMVVSGNFLFLYADTTCGGMLELSPLDYAFHKQALFELIRVSRQDVRIFPLQGPGVKEHKYLSPLMQECISAGFNAELQPVAQRDIIGTEQMLLISRSQDR